MFTLSVCMIVKDEERVLARCLACVKPLADELIVVDTGSTDRTAEIARQYTDRVYFHPWKNDFSEARNYAASLASCDYVMSIDADNVIDDENIERLKRLKANMPEDVDAAALTYRNDIGPFSDYSLRNLIVRRRYAAMYEGEIHETIRVRPEWKRLIAKEICILHRKEYVNEPTRNKDYLERALRTRGRMSDRELSCYCAELLAHGEPQKAVEAYRELIARNADAKKRYHALIFAVGAWMQLGQFDLCAREIVKALETVEHTAYLYCQLGLCHEKLGHVEDAEAAYRTAMRTPEVPETFSLQFTGYTDYFPALRMTAICRQTGRYAEAMRWNDMARKACPQGLEWKWNAILLRRMMDQMNKTEPKRV